MNWGKIYSDLITKAQTRTHTSEPIEKHHAFPYHWFKIGPKKHFDWSIVKLTRREHFIAHKLLCLIYPNCKEAKMAVWRMLNTAKNRKKYNVTSKDYEKYKITFCKSVGEDRKNVIKDKKRRDICSLSMKNLWKQESYRKLMLDIRKDPIKDGSRRNICSQKMKIRNENGLSEQTKQRNKKLNHMTETQIKFLRQNQKKALSGKLPVVFLDGSTKLVEKTFYHQNKGKICFHASSKKAAELLGKTFVKKKIRHKN